MQPTCDAADMACDKRVERYARVVEALAVRGDHQLADLVGAARPLGTGIGGASLLLDVAGVPVFVKRIPLTDREREPDHAMSTANLFDVPVYCQYGIAAFGSAGFGAWRELAAATITTSWVLSGYTEAFPLLYHWRVLPGAPPPTEEHADIERVVAYWGGSGAVRDRLRALAAASASLVLFGEYIPTNLAAFLAARTGEGPDSAAAACAMLESRLFTDIAMMNAGGLVHFDAHFANILTDGSRIYLADLGLATSTRFDLSPAEADFLAANDTHDIGYAAMRLVDWLVTGVCAIGRGDPATRNAYIRAWAEGGQPAGAPDWAAAVIREYAPVAAAMNDFYWHLFGDSRSTPYPTETMRRLLAA